MGNGRQGPLKPEAQKATKEQGAQTQGLVRKAMTGMVASDWLGVSLGFLKWVVFSLPKDIIPT